VKAEGVVAVSAIITGTPMVHELEEAPFICIKNGDFVRINADEGYVEIEKGLTKGDFSVGPTKMIHHTNSRMPSCFERGEERGNERPFGMKI
jgi:hypothetical protein